MSNSSSVWGGARFAIAGGSSACGRSAAVAIVVLAGALDGQSSDNFRSRTPSRKRRSTCSSRTSPQAAGDNALVVFQTPDGITSPSVQPAISASVAALGKIPNVTSVTNPYGPRRRRVHLEERRHRARHRAVRHQGAEPPEGRLRRRSRQPPRRPPRPASRSRTAARSIDYADQPPSGNADLIGLLAAVVILLFAFGSVVAMGLPILTALFGLGVGLSLVHIISSFTEIGTVAPVLATMIGLGVGIDYSLFIVTRYRENLATGTDVEAAVGRSVATAGSAVLFAGTTVVIAICGLARLGHPVRRAARLHGGTRGRGDDARRAHAAPRDHRGRRPRHRPLEGAEPHPPPRPRRRAKAATPNRRPATSGSAGPPWSPATRGRSRSAQ